jgi:L-ascorbate metabolism protein UlaG (beta-lactamase superfamily)
VEITYLGGAAFLLRGRDAVLLTDPGSMPGRTGASLPEANVVTLSAEEAGPPAAARERSRARLLSRPGEYEVSGVLVRGMATRRASQGGLRVAYMVTLDGVVLCHPGPLNRALSSTETAELGDAEVLFLPIAGDPEQTLTPSAASEVVGALSPKIVVPMVYGAQALAMDMTMTASEETAEEGAQGTVAAAASGGGFAALLAPYLKELGVREATPQNRLSVTPTNQPAEMQVVLLQPRGRGS